VSVLATIEDAVRRSTSGGAPSDPVDNPWPGITYDPSRRIPAGGGPPVRNPGTSGTTGSGTGGSFTFGGLTGTGAGGFSGSLGRISPVDKPVNVFGLVVLGAALWFTSK
jgi:hypothetical protein